MTNSDIIGQIIISSTLGVGRVVGIDKIGDDQRYFLVVESVDKKLKNFVPVEDKRSYRTLVSKEEIESILSQLSDKFEPTSHDSKKDRINYFKENSQFQDLETIIKLIRELNQLDDKGSVEDQIFKRLTSSLALEHSIINQVPESESLELVLNALN
jgi:RNA polymerase-interacting CarD/CdnL/TRCF family regulator